MTISQILKKTYREFQKAKINSYFMDAELLLAHILKNTREYILTHPGKKLSLLQTITYKLLTKNRLRGYSVAYLTDHKEFYGLDFAVNKHTLVPRPETELMVEEALRVTRNLKHVTFIDVGVGSGCVIISIIKSLIINSKFKIQNSKFFAIDISKKALKIAKQNARYHQADKHIQFLHGNLLEPLLYKKSAIDNRQSAIFILANLPYLTLEQFKASPSIKKEPKKALVAEDDGLKYYRELFSQIKKYNLLNIIYYILCEIDPSQKEKIKTLVKKYFPNCEIKIKKDLSQKDRLVIIKLT